MTKSPQVEYNYKDILLQPKHSFLSSRLEADTSVVLGGRKFDLPIYPANMKTIIDENLCKWFSSNNLFYTMHRFDVDAVKFTRNMNEAGLVSSISLGVNEDSYDTIRALKSENVIPHYVTVDIAHGDCEKMKKVLGVLRDVLPNTFIIAGNVCVEEGVEFLQDNGAHAVKIGVGPGSVCLTKLKTGFSRPQFSAVLNCAAVAKVPVIADGGIEHNGDCAKAYVAGASLVMAGNIFAGHIESPGEVLTLCDAHGNEYTRKKVYYGSASEHNKFVKKNIEGRKILIDLKGSIEDKIAELKQDLQSSISYAGGKDMSAFLTTKWVVVH